MNNEVKNWKGEVIGFRCYQCGQVHGQMWGEVCNGCRATNEHHTALHSEIREIKEAIKQLTTKS